jgi:hypothetical protein
LQPKLGFGKGGMNGFSEITGKMELNMYNIFLNINSKGKNIP